MYNTCPGVIRETYPCMCQKSARIVPCILCRSLSPSLMWAPRTHCTHHHNLAINREHDYSYWQSWRNGFLSSTRVDFNHRPHNMPKLRKSKYIPRKSKYIPNILAKINMTRAKMGLGYISYLTMNLWHPFQYPTKCLSRDPSLLATNFFNEIIVTLWNFTGCQISKWCTNSKHWYRACDTLRLDVLSDIGP